MIDTFSVSKGIKCTACTVEREAVTKLMLDNKLRGEALLCLVCLSRLVRNLANILNSQIESINRV